MTHPAGSHVADDLRGALAAAGALTFSPVLAPWYRRWGATSEECAAALPGDELVPDPRLIATRATNIAAPPEAVWPWLVQMGHGRAGLYSYEGLENLAGCDMHNADRVEPAWQRLAPGDSVRLGPPGYPTFAVVSLARFEHLVLLAGGDEGIRNSWSFVLRRRGEGASRLVVRSRYAFPATPGQWVMWRAITEPLHFVMERRMLLGIRSRAEAAAAS